MKCPNCNSDEAREILTTKAIKDKAGAILIVDNVPLISCNSCGEGFYRPEAIREMDEIRKHPEKANEKTVKYYELDVA